MAGKFSIPLNEKLKKRKKLLVLGGFGYGNVGDEAQLACDIKELKNYFHKSDITVLSPNPQYTSIQHENINSIYAPRVAFFDQGKSKLYAIQYKNTKNIFYRIANQCLKLLFLFRIFWIYINARLIKAGSPIALLKPQRIVLLEALKNSDFVFFSGGGYLTGATLSRLWDGILFIKLASIFGKPVFLSGQTIGIWNSKFTKAFSRWAFKDVKEITVRDPDDSFRALQELNLPNRVNYNVCCDDALFCEKAKTEDIDIDGLDIMDGNYIVIQFHYWGANNPDEKAIIRNYITSIVQRNANSKIVFISMTPSDEDSIADFFSENENTANIFVLKYNYDYQVVRTVIANALYCITMKHHPIIFALGETVPVISLNYSQYYQHKNTGALKLFNMDKYAINMETDSVEQVMELIEDIKINNLAIREALDIKLIKIKKDRDAFFQNINGYL